MPGVLAALPHGLFSRTIACRSDLALQQLVIEQLMNGILRAFAVDRIGVQIACNNEARAGLEPTTLATVRICC